MFGLLRNYLIVSPKQLHHFILPPATCYYVFFITVIGVGGKQHLTVALTRMSLMAGDGEHLITCSLSLGKDLSRSLARVLIGLPLND